MSKRSVAVLNLVVWVPLVVLLVIGMVAPPIQNSAVQVVAGWLAAGLFSAGVLSAGLFSVGVYAAGVFSIGIFSVGVFSVGVFSFGTYTIGIWSEGPYPLGVFTNRIGVPGIGQRR